METELITIAAGWAVGMFSFDLINAFLQDLLWPILENMWIQTLALSTFYNNQDAPQLKEIKIGHLSKAIVSWGLSILVVYVVIYTLFRKMFLRP